MQESHKKENVLPRLLLYPRVVVEVLSQLTPLALHQTSFGTILIWVSTSLLGVLLIHLLPKNKYCADTNVWQQKLGIAYIINAVEMRALQSMCSVALKDRGLDC